MKNLLGDQAWFLHANSANAWGRCQHFPLSQRERGLFSAS